MYSINFESKLVEALNRVASEYSWDTEWPVDESSRVDVVGLLGEVPKVLVEVELKKDNPVENVVKVWRWAKATKHTEPILFIQAFSALYANPENKKARPPKEKQFVRSQFIGERMAEDRPLQIAYKQMPICSTTRGGVRIPFRPRLRRGFVTKERGTSMHRAAKELADDINSLLRLK
jgi:hypothetical protein